MRFAKAALAVVLAGGIFLVTSSTPSVHAAGVGLVLVVGKGSPLNNITKAELVHVFSSDPIMVEGQRLVPFSLTPSSPERQTFDRAVLGMSPDQANKFWIDKRIRGQGNPPKSAPSAEVVAKVVANFPGAIGYVPANALTPALKPVTIDGKPYTDPAYLLSQGN